MRANDGTRTGGEILIDQLVAHGVQHVFCVPGESYLAALDAFYDRPIQLTVCRQEGGATMMAEAHGKATGRPGIVFVTRGPGATNASPGIHIAQQDSTPLIVFVGQVGREMRERDAFQELNYRAVFGSIAKWATEIDDPARIPELVSRAFYAATSGRPGPVVIALPEDMLTERVAVPDAPPFEPVEIWPGQADMAKLQKMLWAAKQPVVLAGGSRWSEAARASLAPLRRTLRHSGRHHVPPRQPDGLAASELRRRPRHRAESEAARAHQGGRSHRADRRPARRDAVAELHAARDSGPAADAGACPPWRRGTRPGLSPASRHQRCADRICGGARRPAAAERDFVARSDQAGPCRLYRVDREGDAAARPRQLRRDHRLAARARAGRDPLQRGRQFHHLGATLLPAEPVWPALRADGGLDGLRVAGVGRHQAALSRPHGGLRRRRRRLPDERTGVHDGGAIRLGRSS